MGASFSREFVIDKLLPSLADMQGRVGLAVGVMADATNSMTGQHVAEYAVANEYGSQEKNIPPRPFLRETFDRYQKGYAGALAEELSDGVPPETAMRRLGEVMTGDVKAAISTWKTPPNSKETIERKGGRNTPLRDTGSLLKSITYRVDAER